MTIYDISVPIHADMAVWPGDPKVERTMRAEIAKGAGANISVVSLGAHTGTHIDAPRHFEPDGITVERLDNNAMVGPAQVVEIPTDGNIGAEQFEAAGIRPDTKRILLKTANTRRGLMRSPEFHTDFVAVTPDGADWLLAHGIRLVGVDYLSVAIYHEPGGVTHHKLLQNGVVPLEGCDMSGVPVGDYLLVCAAMNLVGSDGAPARVYLIADD